MMSLWADDCTFTFNGTTFSGKDAARTFLLSTGSWHHHRISLVPSFKDQVTVDGDTVTHVTNSGTIRNIGGSWLFWRMHFGSAAPMSVDTIYT
jgi:hypothetical protein